MNLDPQLWGTVADWVTTITAVVGVGYGARQLFAIRKTEQAGLVQAKVASAAQTATAKAHSDWVQVQRGQFLMRLDDRFESEVMGLSKRAHRALRNRFEREANDALRDRSNAARATEAARLFSAHMTAVWRETRTLDTGADPTAAHPIEDGAAKGYAQIMRLPYWIETVGFLVRKGLIGEDDILLLYDQVIITTIGNIRQHVADRADEGPHPNRRFLENAVWICDRAVARKHRLDQLSAGEPSPSGLDES